MKSATLKKWYASDLRFLLVEQWAIPCRIRGHRVIQAPCFNYHCSAGPDGLHSACTRCASWLDD